MMRIPENHGNTWSIVPDSLAQSVATQGTKRNAHAMRLGTSDARLSPMQPVPESFLDRLVPSPDRQVRPSMSLVGPATAIINTTTRSCSELLLVI